MIPSAEEYFRSCIPKYEKSVSDFMTSGDIFYHAKEFAKMHVKAALEAASNLGKETWDWTTEECNSITEDAYPETNIK